MKKLLTELTQKEYQYYITGYNVQHLKAMRKCKQGGVH